jgi:hypothetical protein
MIVAHPKKFNDEKSNIMIEMMKESNDKYSQMRSIDLIMNNFFMLELKYFVAF